MCCTNKGKVHYIFLLDLLTLPPPSSHSGLEPPKMEWVNLILNAIPENCWHHHRFPFTEIWGETNLCVVLVVLSWWWWLVCLSSMRWVRPDSVAAQWVHHYTTTPLHHCLPSHCCYFPACQHTSKRPGQTFLPTDPVQASQLHFLPVFGAGGVPPRQRERKRKSNKSN